MKKAVSFKRYDNLAGKEKGQQLQNTIIQKWATAENVEIIAEFEAVSTADTIFNKKGWRELEIFVKENAIRIDFIVTARFSILCDSNVSAVMEKAEFFGDYGIQMSIASQE